MSNKIYAQEWLELAKHNLQGAEILFAADHFTDVIGCEIQQAIENEDCGEKFRWEFRH
jgi:hypothetical protein